jgi:hypothetical protein
MDKQTENTGSDDINSRILLMILDELRYIRNRMDLAIGPGQTPTAPAPPPLAAFEKTNWEAEIVEPEPAPEKPAKTPTPPKPKPKPKPAAETKPKPKPAPKKPKPKPEPVQPAAEAPKTKPKAPKPEPKKTEDFGLKKPSSPQEQDQLFSAQKERIENMMAVAQFSRAEKLAQALLAIIPDSLEAESLLETVRRESTAFRKEQQTRLFSEFQKWTESRQWIKAQSIGEQLIAQYPASEEGQTVAASMDTVRNNAHFEEARTLRDRIRDLIKRKRYAEAVEIAEDLIRRFPNTQVARQLKSLLPDLKRRHAQFR